MDYNLGPFRIKPRGEFNATAEYRFLDMVTYDGGSFICINYDTIDGTACIGILPEGQASSELYWQNIAHKGEKGDTADQYLPFIEVTNGNWDFNNGDKIYIPDTATTDNLEIQNVYDGCCGMIITTRDLVLPGNSLYKNDFHYINLTSATGYYMYTFTYGKIGSDYKFIFSRGIIDG